MSIAFWNIRGASRKNALPEVKDFCRHSRISVMMLCEVKTQSPPSSSTAQQLGFHHFDFIPTQGFAGGIWLFWKDCNLNPFRLSVILKSSRFMVCNYHSLSHDFIFAIIFIYAPARQDQKSEFWEELVLYINSLTTPFVVLGDFNEIGCAQDKLGGARFSSSRTLILSSFFSQAQCAEIPFLGSRYTWRKKEGGENNIYERLDRATASISWLAQFPQARVRHHNFTSSDHCYVSLEFECLNRAKAFPFRFDKLWCSRKDYDNIVKKSWCSHFEGSHMFRLVNKCKLLKTNSKKWNLTQFGNSSRQIRTVDRKLEDIQSAILNDQLNIQLLKKQDLLLLKRSKLLAFNHEFWKQKSKTTYLTQGDANTSYYHAHASIRRNRNQISEFVSQDNISLTTPAAITSAITHEFAQRFLSNPDCSFDSQSDFSLISPLISEEDNLFLCAPPSGEEIKGATFDLAPDKSLGPDGFPPGFFQKYWTLVGNSVIRAVQAFFHSGKLLKEINHTFLA
ncbi:uncharacterized protein LOC130590222 [Beta vulgaris subsp. vulgaris]|uniref:uncharacterized protein LOC130590222 n=1 Tax=Beta vulgaris subsp. vulgaris TaxID=3555 RepID=UPI002547309D|nr:uncharacterized protein LOC130590222 [Beta vulgaris subsp. vulgaris]